MKKLISILLTLALASACTGAYALTGADALGLISPEDSSGGDSDFSGGVTDSAPTRYPTLQVGSRDGDDSAPRVVMLQIRLLELGYLASTADGQYGAATQAAVVAFQQNNGILATGIADATTQAVLYSDEAARAPEVLAKDANVLRVQQMLSLWGFLAGRCDGILGESTRTAIAEFKSYLYVDNADLYAGCATPTPMPAATPMPGEQPVADDVPLPDPDAVAINVNGFDGEITEDLLRFADGDYPFRIYRATVRLGDENSEVWRVQRRLYQCNYLYKPDGACGRLTELALRYFQRKNNLPETGIADEATQNILFSNDAEPAEEYVFPYKIGVSLSQQRTYVFQWDGEAYSKQVKCMKCSTGMAGAETPAGTYQADGKATTNKWYYMADFNNYVQYAYRILGGIMFHSVLFNAQKKGPTNSSVHALGKRASHGCIRLSVKDAQWIFENCPAGTTVVIR